MKYETIANRMNRIARKRMVMITLLFGLFSALSSYLLFDTMEGFKSEIKESRITVKQMTEQVNDIEEKYQSEIHYWLVQNSLLNNRIQQTELALEQSRKKEKSLQGKILSLVAEGKTLTDTSALFSNCDTLREKVVQFISETNIRDSLCTSEINDLKEVIGNQDSALVISRQSFSMLKQVTDSSLAHQLKLTEDLNRANKKLRRENRKSKILSAGVMILSGATTILLLQK